MTMSVTFDSGAETASAWVPAFAWMMDLDAFASADRYAVAGMTMSVTMSLAILALKRRQPGSRPSPG